MRLQNNSSVHRNSGQILISLGAVHKRRRNFFRGGRGLQISELDNMGGLGVMEITMSEIFDKKTKHFDKKSKKFDKQF